LIQIVGAAFILISVVMLQLHRESPSAESLIDDVPSVAG
jgi:hypothetical protein